MSNIRALFPGLCFNWFHIVNQVDDVGAKLSRSMGAKACMMPREMKLVLTYIETRLDGWLVASFLGSGMQIRQKSLICDILTHNNDITGFIFVMV